MTDEERIHRLRADVGKCVMEMVAAGECDDEAVEQTRDFTAIFDRLDYLEALALKWRTAAMEHGLTITEALDA